MGVIGVKDIPFVIRRIFELNYKLFDEINKTIPYKFIFEFIV